MEQLIENSKSIMDGLNDLDQMLTDEDPGAGYVKRLAKEMQDLWCQILVYDHEHKPSKLECIQK